MASSVKTVTRATVREWAAKRGLVAARLVELPSGRVPSADTTYDLGAEGAWAWLRGEVVPADAAWLVASGIVAGELAVEVSSDAFTGGTWVRVEADGARRAVAHLAHERHSTAGRIGGVRECGKATSAEEDERGALNNVGAACARPQGHSGDCRA